MLTKPLVCRAILALAGFSTAFTTAMCQSAEAATLCVNVKNPACFSTIGAAVAAAAAGDTIQVAAGTYKEDVVITKSLSLLGAAQQAGGLAGTSIIDAKGLSNGIFVSGTVGVPGSRISEVVIAGFTIASANFEGILVVNASNVTIWNNQVIHNDLGLDIAGMQCLGQPAFETNEGDDCGEGIHLMGVDHSTVAQNVSELNSGGILITDETGASYDNLITGNTVRDNPFDCGITLASHPPAPATTAALPFGIYHNTISQNQSTGNGLQLPGAGAGIGIFAPFPGTTNSANVIIGNQLSYNGLPGVTMHNHAASPMAPPVNMNDNVIIGNTITGNGADTEDAATPGTAGINIFSIAPVTGTIVSQNKIGQEVLDVVFNAPGELEAHLNDFEGSGTGVYNLGAGTVNATQNWWGCAAGPNKFGCLTVLGSGVVFVPVLTQPF
jgi:hypothetical protein